MKLVAEYKISHAHGMLRFPTMELNILAKKIKMITKRLVELKKEGCVIKNIKSKPVTMYDESLLYLHVRVWE